jgi:hypothetical protein
MHIRISSICSYKRAPRSLLMLLLMTLVNREANRVRAGKICPEVRDTTPTDMEQHHRFNLLNVHKLAWSHGTFFSQSVSGSELMLLDVWHAECTEACSDEARDVQYGIENTVALHHGPLEVRA